MEKYMLGAFVQSKRNEMGMSLREFGKHCGISHTTIDCIEKGYDPRTGKAVNITNNTIGKLSRALNVSMAKLVELSQGIEKTADQMTGELSEEEMDYIRWYRTQATEKEKEIVRLIISRKPKD